MLFDSEFMEQTLMIYTEYKNHLLSKNLWSQVSSEEQTLRQYMKGKKKILFTVSFTSAIFTATAQNYQQ